MLKVFLDYQNAFRTLRDHEGVAILSLDLGGIIREIVEDLGEVEAQLHRAFSGIHSKEFNPTSRVRMRKVAAIMQRRDRFDMYLSELTYFEHPDGYKEVKEKGIDVRIACELMTAALDPLVTCALLWSSDQDFAEAITMSKKLARSIGKKFEVFCLYLEGIHPVRGGVPVKLTQTMLYRHRRNSEVEDLSAHFDQEEESCAVVV